MRALYLLIGFLVGVAAATYYDYVRYDKILPADDDDGWA